MPLESRSYRRADCSKQGQYVPKSVETHLTSPRLDCLKREQRHRRHLFAKRNTTHSLSGSANDTVDLHHFTFHLPICFPGRLNFINLAFLHFNFIFQPMLWYSRDSSYKSKVFTLASAQVPNSRIPTSLSKMYLTSDNPLHPVEEFSSFHHSISESNLASIVSGRGWKGSIFGWRYKVKN